MRRLLGLFALLAGCSPAPVSPEDSERQRIFLTAIEPCKRQYPSIREVELDHYGTLSAETRSSAADWDGFRRCAEDALAQVAEKRPYGAGRLAAKSGWASISYKPAGNLILVPAVLNDVEATLLFDTGSSVTIVRPDFARRAGMEVGPTAPRMTIRVAGGERFSVPFVKARALRVGDATVEELDVGIAESLLRQFPATVDGVLGNNYLNHFRVTIDRQARRLVLAPVANPRQRLNRDSKL
jgi:hypothetical protein